MKYFFLIILFPLFIHSQENNDQDKEDKERKFSIGFAAGIMNQSFEENGDPLTNQASNMAGFALQYQSSEFSHLRLGYDRFSTVSFSGLSFDSYTIPLLYGLNLDWLKSLYGGVKNPNIKLLVELGVYYRGISNFKNQSSIDYNTHKVFGFQTAFVLKFDLSNSLFANISIQGNNDYDDILDADNNAISLSGYALQLGFAFRL